MEKTVEFKIRVPEVDRWEDTPVHLSKPLSGSAEEIAKEAEEIAEGIAFSQHSEVRWNYEGDTQGHYVDEGFPDTEIYEERILLLPGAEADQVGVAAN